MPERDQRFKDFTEASSDWYWEMDENCRFSYFSARLTEITGVPAEDLLGKTREETGIPNVEPGAWQQHLSDLAAHRSFKYFRHSRTLPDGRVVHLSINGKAIFDEQGLFRGYRGTGSDITQFITAEEALRASEARFRGVFDQGSVGMAILTPAGYFLQFNKAYCSYLGYPAEDLIGGHFNRVIHPDDYDAVEARLQQLLDGDVQAYQHERRYRHKAGHTLWGLAGLSLLRSPTGSPIGIVAQVQDITQIIEAESVLQEARDGLEQAVAARTAELEQANRLLQDSEKRFRNLFESEPIAVREEDFSKVKAAIDALGIEDDVEFAAYLDDQPEFIKECVNLIVMVDANRAALELHGLDDKAEFLANFTKNLTGKAHSTLKTLLVAMHRGETLVEFETSVTPADGSNREVMARWSVAAGYEETYARILLTSVDITERKLAEEQLRQAQKMDAVGKLTGGVAHDFNNLLAVIMGNTEILQGRLGRGDNLLEAIVRATKRGAELTQRLLAFSRQQPLRPQAIDLGALVADMSGLLTRSLGETIEMEIRAAPGLWHAVADPGQVENALLNLALNARDAMPGGGKLTVECANVRLDETYVAENPEVKAGDYVMLAVSDAGVGMTAEVRASAFEPFYTTKEVGQGSGLGLSMVYGFAKQSGGQVTLYSEEGKGTTVKLYLPQAAVASRREIDRPAQEVLQGAGEMILVVEDDPEVRALAVQLLEDLDYRVIDVPDAAAAQAALADGKPVDLVLSDVILPGGISGPAFAEQALAAYPDLKLIFMSGYPAEAAKRNGFLGSDQVLLNKPFQMHTLAKALREALG